MASLGHNELALVDSSIIFQHGDGTGHWNPSPWRTRTHLSCIINMHGCRHPGHGRSHGISIHCIDLICPNSQNKYIRSQSYRLLYTHKLAQTHSWMLNESLNHHKHIQVSHTWLLHTCPHHLISSCITKHVQRGSWVVQMLLGTIYLISLWPRDIL